jgi:hypothetical protein
VREVDPLDLLEEAVHEVLARLLAVRDDVQPGVLLRLDPQQRGVGLGLRSASPSASTAARACGFGQPAGLGRLPAIVVGNMAVASWMDECFDCL